MFRLALAAVVALALLISPSPARAAEPYLEFLDGLRSAGLDEHFEAAYEYLDQIEKRPDLPSDIRDLLSFERGQTLLANSKRVTSAELQRRLLNDAEAAFNKFTREHAGHPLAGEANFQRAQLILQKSWVEIFAALDPVNAPGRLDLQGRARTFADQAKDAFATAQKQLKVELDKYPASEMTLSDEERSAKRKVEGRYLSAQYEQAMCAYAVAQSYRDPDAETQPQIFKTRVTAAADEFLKFYERYRQQLFGRYALLMQAKCLEEQDDLRPALAIYDSILKELEDGDRDIDLLKDKALRFWLGAMNHPTKKEYAQVEERAAAWMQKHKDRLRTDSGLGIAYELALALKEQAKEPGVTPTRKAQMLGRAQELANTLARGSAEFRTRGVLLQREIAGMRNRTLGPVTSFSEAMNEADTLLPDLKPLLDAYQGAIGEGDAKGIAEKRKALFEHADRLVRIYDQGLVLANNDSDPKLVAAARTRLAYAYFLQEKFLEAATVADYQVQKFGSGVTADAAREAAYIAIAALDVTYRRSPKDDRGFEQEALTRAADALLRRWPESERASDVRLILGSVQFDNGEYAKAIEEWQKIKPESGQYGSAEVKTGFADWRLYAQGASKGTAGPGATELARLKADAVKHLENGVAVLAKGASGTTPPDDLVLGKLTLAVIRIQDGVYTKQGNIVGARELLTEPPFAVIDAVEVPEGQKRPRDPASPRSRQMASYAYQQLLKTYIGLKDIDKAQVARTKLESIAVDGGAEAEALTQIFVDFGRELQNQLKQLQAQGETVRLAEVRDGFESFLNDIQKRSEGHDWNTRLWVAETFASLGESASDNDDAARGYFAKAAESYRQMLDEPAKAPGPDYVAACRLQLARVFVRGKEFQKAEDSILEVIKQKSSDIGAQLAAADLYRQWGDAGAPDAAKKFQTAVYGQKGPPELWGYNKVGRDVQRQMLQESDEGKRELYNQLRMDARYREAQALQQLGRLQPTDDDRITVLNRAAKAVMAVAAAKLPRPEYERFNALFQQIQGDLGLVAVELSDSGKVVLTDPKKKKAAPPPADVPVTEEGKVPASKANVGVIAGMVVIGLAAVGGILFYANQQQKQQLSRLAALAAGSGNRGSRRESADSDS